MVRKNQGRHCVVKDGQEMSGNFIETKGSQESMPCHEHNTACAVISRRQ